MHLWLLTEEYPRLDTIIEILKKYSELKEYCKPQEINPIKIKPIKNEGKFASQYRFTGLSVHEIDKINIIVVSGKSSFVDYLLFECEERPNHVSIPFMVIEETKTDAKEGRNVAAYQRGTKFAYIDSFYDSPDIHKYMIYTHQTNDIERNKSINFGMRMKIFNGIKIIGKRLPEGCNLPWRSLQQFIADKNDFARDLGGANVPLKLYERDGKIYASARLVKRTNGRLRLGHDPNIGYILLVAMTLKRLEYDDELIITNHGLSQEMVNSPNKFTMLASKYDIKLEGLNIPQQQFPDIYWKTETRSEKCASIFLNLAIEYSEENRVIYSNHAGCERGYFYDQDDYYHAVRKYIGGNQVNGVIRLPDLICQNLAQQIILNLEGKKSTNKAEGLRQLNDLHGIEGEYIRLHYPDYAIQRGLVLYGGARDYTDDKILFQLQQDGTVLVSESAPEFLKQAVRRFIA